jgi:hypothetical protein
VLYVSGDLDLFRISIFVFRAFIFCFGFRVSCFGFSIFFYLNSNLPFSPSRQARQGREGLVFLKAIDGSRDALFHQALTKVE